MEYCYHVLASALDYYFDILKKYSEIGSLCYWPYICLFSSPAGTHCNVVSIGQFLSYFSIRYPFEFVK